MCIGLSVEWFSVGQVSHLATVSVQAISTISSITAVEGTPEAVAVAAVAEPVAAEVATSFQFATFSVLDLFGVFGLLLSVAGGQHGDQEQHLFNDFISVKPVQGRINKTDSFTSAKRDMLIC